MSMADKYDNTSARDAHWRIDGLGKTVDGLTITSSEHGKELESIRSVHRSVKIVAYTALAIFVASEVGLLAALRGFIGI